MHTAIGRPDIAAAALPFTPKVALIGTYPPQRCGIASFTENLRNAMGFAEPRLRTTVCAISPPGAATDFPDEVSIVVRRDIASDYERAAMRLNAAGVDGLSLQHEFGIFGGEAGDYLLRLLDRADASVVSTLHTISPNLNAAQSRVLTAIADRSDRIVTMAQKGRNILVDAFGVDPAKIVVIPHGVPSRAPLPRDAMKERLGFAGRDVLMTFGLISRGKGLETAIRAMPAIAASHPEAIYVILGATHPAILKQEGERYREMLTSLARDLGVERHVLFINQYVGADELIEYLSAADVYVTPYLNEAQITSGTLSYAFSLGVPVISTRYWHAAELLRDDRGALVPFGDSAALSEAANRLLADPQLRRRLSKRAISDSEAMRWPAVGARYFEIFKAIHGGALETPSSNGRSRNAHA